MAAAKQTGAAQSGFTSSDKARFLLRPAQKSDQLCKNPKPCSYGDRCIFAHNMEEQRRFRQAYSSSGNGNGGSSQGDKQASGSKATGQPDSQAQAKQSYCPPDKFKTLLCYYFQRQGYCTRGAQCSFAHGASELRSNSQPSSRDGATAEFSPVPPPPVAVRAPSSIASVASDSAGSGSGGGSMHSARSGDAEVHGSIAAAELDEAYALQLQYDEQRGLKEEAQQAQQAQRAPGGSYAAAAVGGTDAPTAVPPPPGLALPRLDNEAAFPSLHASGTQSKAGSAATRSQLHSRAPSSGGCSAADGASPVTACPSEEGELRAPSSCNASVAAEAELAVHAAEGTDCAPEGGSAEEAEQQQQHEGQLCGTEGGEAGVAAGAAGPQRSASHSSWADEAEAEEAEELKQRMEAAAPALLPPPPPAVRPPPQLRSTPPAEALLQALRSSSAAAAAAAATAAPADSGSPVGHGVLPPPGFRPRPKAAAPAMQPRPRLHPIDLVGTNGGVDLSVIPHFVCPLTSRPFVDPVVAADGVTYERDVIEFLLYRKNIEVSPVLRGVRLEHNMLAPNTALLCAMGEVAALLASMAAAP